MREMIDLQLAKQGREAILHEVQMNRQADAVRTARRKRRGTGAALGWEIGRYVGRILKALRSAG